MYAIRSYYGLTEEERKLLDGLGGATADIDTLAARAGLTIDQAAGTMLDLEMRGAVKRLPGMRFSRA